MAPRWRPITKKLSRSPTKRAWSDGQWLEWERANQELLAKTTGQSVPWPLDQSDKDWLIENYWSKGGSVYTTLNLPLPTELGVASVSCPGIDHSESNTIINDKIKPVG